jgi:hypothetical protein
VFIFKAAQLTPADVFKNCFDSQDLLDGDSENERFCDNLDKAHTPAGKVNYFVEILEWSFTPLARKGSGQHIVFDISRLLVVITSLRNHRDALFLVTDGTKGQLFSEAISMKDARIR